MISMNIDMNTEHWDHGRCPKYDCKKDACKCGLKKVFLASALGDDSKDSPIAPKNGAYCNAIVAYEANGHIYIYSSEGIPTLVETEGSGLEEAIKKLEDDLANEVTDRAAADNVLQTEIDDLKNSPDVVDIVATYAALQAYDTSHLGNNDIIRVLADETHDGQSTYYRWNKQSSTWTYIGTVGDYYTKSQTDTLLAGKQDTLTAGPNITITNDTISATDTTYSAFTGTDGTAAGTAGLVPAPATTDAGKYLKADGTWDTVNAGPTVVQTIGTSTTSVMSQDATTSMVYTPKQTSNSSNMGAVWIGNKDSNNAVIGDPSSSGGHKTYFYALPGSVNSAGNYTVDILGTTVAGSATVIGYSATSTNYGISIGRNAAAGSLGAVSIGYNSEVDINCDYSVAIGNAALASRSGEVNIGAGSTTHGYNSTAYRLLGGVHDAVDAHDAVTLGQLTAYSVVSGAGAPTTSTVAKYIGQFYYDTTNDGYYYCTAITAQGTTPETYSYTWTALSTGGSGPTVVQTIGSSTTDVMSQNAASRMIYTKASNNETYAIGIRGGSGIDTSAGAGSIAIGDGSFSRGDNSVAVGAATAVYASGAYSTAIGNSAKTENHSRAVALGNAANAAFDNSVAIGTNAVTTVAGEVNVGAGTSGRGYNNTNYRIIGGVHDPVNAHDAATKGYVDGRVTQNAGAPTTATAGTVGQLLEDTTNGKLYQCTAINTTDPQNPSYTWTEVGAGGGGGDTVYSTKTTSNSTTGGAVYIGNLDSNQDEQADPMPTDNHYKYFWALPNVNSVVPTDGSINILGDLTAVQGMSLGPGASSAASNYYSISIGLSANTAASGAHGAIAIGAISQSGAEGGVSIGRSSKINSTVYKHSVALGSFAAVSRKGEVNIGTGGNNLGYNNTDYRVIGGVHDGINAHDAVTVGQLNTVLNTFYVDGDAYSPSGPDVGISLYKESSLTTKVTGAEFSSALRNGNIRIRFISTGSSEEILNSPTIITVPTADTIAGFTAQRPTAVFFLSIIPRAMTTISFNDDDPTGTDYFEIDFIS